jgi:hypothetical protein
LSFINPDFANFDPCQFNYVSNTHTSFIMPFITLTSIRCFSLSYTFSSC